METSKLVLNDRVFPSVAESRARVYTCTCMYTQIHSRATVSLQFVKAVNLNHRESASGWKFSVIGSYTRSKHAQDYVLESVHWFRLAHGKDVTQRFIALLLFALSLL